MKVVAADGRRWRVRRRWVPPETWLLTAGFWRRWLGWLAATRDLALGAIVSLKDDIRMTGLVAIVVPLLLFGVTPLIIGFGLVLLLVDTGTCLLVGTPLLVLRLVGRRPWRVDVEPDEGDDGFAVEGGWSVKRAVAADLRQQ